MTCNVLAGHAGGINCLDVSPDGRFLVAVGLNKHSKQLVILWSIAGLTDGHKVAKLLMSAAIFIMLMLGSCFVDVICLLYPCGWTDCCIH